MYTFKIYAGMNLSVFFASILVYYCLITGSKFVIFFLILLWLVLGGAIWSHFRIVNKYEAIKNGLEAEKASLEAIKSRLESAKSSLESDKASLESAKVKLEKEKHQIEIDRDRITTEKLRIEKEKDQIEKEKYQIQIEKANLETQVERENHQLQIEKSNLEADRNRTWAEKDQLEKEKIGLIEEMNDLINSNKEGFKSHKISQAAKELGYKIFNIEQSDEDQSGEKLTEREISVLALVKDGMSNKEIAASLGMDPGSIKNIIAPLFKKRICSR